MDPIHNSAILKKYRYLVKNLDYNRVRDYFIESGVFSISICHEIDAKPVGEDKTRKFIDTFLMRGRMAYPTLIHALKDSGSSFIANELDNTVKELKEPKNNQQQTFQENQAVPLSSQCDINQDNVYRQNQPKNASELNAKGHGPGFQEKNDIAVNPTETDIAVNPTVKGRIKRSMETQTRW